MKSDKNTAHLLLGSNLGNREAYIDEALRLLKERVGTVLKISSIYETEAWGDTDQPGFLNIAAEINTALNPSQLLETVLKIEADLGRVRHEKWGSRLIDIDIIFYGDEVIALKDQLQIPHPEMQHRKFVLLPLSEIAPNVIHPVFGLSISELLANLKDDLAVIKR